MKRPAILLYICIAVFALLLLAGYGAYHFVLSPSANLKQVLHISTIPKSVKNLKMGCDVLAPNETDSFYFTVTPDDLHELLAGRQFQCVTSTVPQELSTLYLAPSLTISGHSSYEWKTNGAECRILTDDSHEHVIVPYCSD